MARRLVLTKTLPIKSFSVNNGIVNLNLSDENGIPHIDSLFTGNQHHFSKGNICAKSNYILSKFRKRHLDYFANRSLLLQFSPSNPEMVKDPLGDFANSKKPKYHEGDVTLEYATTHSGIILTRVVCQGDKFEDIFYYKAGFRGTDETLFDVDLNLIIKDEEYNALVNSTKNYSCFNLGLKLE